MEKQEAFSEYYRNELVKGRILPVMPREKWDKLEDYQMYLRHLAAYMIFARAFVSDKLILEIGCGTGYGTNYLSKYARNVIAVDVWREGIQYCRGKYAKDNLTFLLANGVCLPFESDSFDVAVSFQVIEHVNPQNVLPYLLEIKRVLKREGLFILSTVNSRLRLLPFQKPWNPEHTKEYDSKKLKNLLGRVFKEVNVYGLCGTEEILDVESNRVKQDPYRVYLLTPFHRILNSILPPFILHQLRKIKRLYPNNRIKVKHRSTRQNFNDYSIKDFTVDINHPQDWIDLLGICKKCE